MNDHFLNPFLCRSAFTIQAFNIVKCTWASPVCFLSRWVVKGSTEQEVHPCFLVFEYINMISVRAKLAKVMRRTSMDSEEGNGEYGVQREDEPTSANASACLPGCFVVRARHCVSWGTQKYTNPTEGAFLAGIGPPTHSSLFKPPPILYSSVRGGLLTQPNYTQQKLDLYPTKEGGHALVHIKTQPCYSAIATMKTHTHVY